MRRGWLWLQDEQKLLDELSSFIEHDQLEYVLLPSPQAGDAVRLLWDELHVRLLVVTARHKDLAPLLAPERLGALQLLLVALRMGSKPASQWFADIHAQTQRLSKCYKKGEHRPMRNALSKFEMGYDHLANIVDLADELGLQNLLRAGQPGLDLLSKLSERATYSTLLGLPSAVEAWRVVVLPLLGLLSSVGANNPSARQATACAGPGCSGDSGEAMDVEGEVGEPQEPGCVSCGARLCSTCRSGSREAMLSCEVEKLAATGLVDSSGLAEHKGRYMCILCCVHQLVARLAEEQENAMSTDQPLPAERAGVAAALRLLNSLCDAAWGPSAVEEERTRNAVAAAEEEEGGEQDEEGDEEGKGDEETGA